MLRLTSSKGSCVVQDALDVIEDDGIKSQLPEHNLGPDLHPCGIDFTTFRNMTTADTLW